MEWLVFAVALLAFLGSLVWLGCQGESMPRGKPGYGPPPPPDSLCRIACAVEDIRDTLEKIEKKLGASGGSDQQAAINALAARTDAAAEELEDAVEEEK